MDVRTDQLGSRLFVAVFAGVFLLVGVGFAGTTALGEIQDLNERRSLSTTEGEVTDSGLANATERNPDSATTEKECYPRANFTYSVDGERYEGNRIYHPRLTTVERGELRGKDFDDCTVAADVVAEYEPGSTVTVYYDPGDPGTAYLRVPSFQIVTLLGALLIGAVFGLPGALGVRYAFTSDLNDGGDGDDGDGDGDG